MTRSLSFHASRLTGIAIFILGCSHALAAPPQLALNAPSCAQEVENHRRECLRKCENAPMKAQCERACGDPDKLSPRLAECEKRKQLTSAVR